jgi:hypothetical protein
VSPAAVEQLLYGLGALSVLGNVFAGVYVIKLRKAGPDGKGLRR